LRWWQQRFWSSPQQPPQAAQEMMALAAVSTCRSLSRQFRMRFRVNFQVERHRSASSHQGQFFNADNGPTIQFGMEKPTK